MSVGNAQNVILYGPGTYTGQGANPLSVSSSGALTTAAADASSGTTANVASSTGGNALLVATGSQTAQVALNAVTGNTTSSAIDLGSVTNALMLAATVTGAPTTATLQIQTSVDNVNFIPAIPASALDIHAISTQFYVFTRPEGNANGAAGVVPVGGMPARYVKVILAGVTGGTSPTFTVKVASVD